MLLRPTSAALVAAALCTGAGAAQDRSDFEWSGEIPAGAELRVFNLRGDIAVVPASGSVTRIRGRAGPDGSTGEVRFQLLRDGEDVVVCAVSEEPGSSSVCETDGVRHRDRRRGPDAWAEFTVELPRGVHLRASTGGGAVEVSGATGRVHASSGSGDIRVRGPAESVRASSGSGDLTIEEARGPVRATTGSGEIDVRIVSLAREGDLEFSSGSGDVRLTLPEDLSAEIQMTTGSGSFESDFPLQIQGRMSSHRVRGVIGEGGRQIRISTGSGDVSLRRRS